MKQIEGILVMTEHSPSKGGIKGGISLFRPSVHVHTRAYYGVHELTLEALPRVQTRVG